jgi:hypothetical protein
MERKVRSRREKLTTSKALLWCVMMTYFVGVALGIYIVIAILHTYPADAVSAFVALLSYIGAPIIVTVGFYEWKAKHENLNKKRKEGKENGDNCQLETISLAESKQP